MLSEFSEKRSRRNLSPLSKKKKTQKNQPSYFLLVQIWETYFLLYTKNSVFFVLEEENKMRIWCVLRLFCTRQSKGMP